MMAYDLSDEPTAPKPKAAEQPKAPVVVPTPKLSRKQSKRLRAALNTLFGPSLVMPDPYLDPKNKPDAHRVYVDTPGSRVVGFVEYNSTRNEFTLHFGPHSFVESPSEESRTAWVEALRPHYHRMRKHAKTLEEARLAKAKAEQAAIRKEKLALKAMRMRLQRDLERAKRKFQASCGWGHCSVRQLTYRDLSLVPNRAAYRPECVEEADYSRLCFYPVFPQLGYGLRAYRDRARCARLKLSDLEQELK